MFLDDTIPAGFVADHVGEKERVAERLEQEAVENPVTGSQHFWQGEVQPASPCNSKRPRMARRDSGRTLPGYAQPYPRGDVPL